MQNPRMHQACHQRLVAGDLLGFPSDRRPNRIKAGHACLRPSHTATPTPLQRRTGTLFGAAEKSRDKSTNAEVPQTGRGGSSCAKWIASRIVPGAEAPALGADQQRRRGVVGHRRPAEADKVGVEPEPRAPSRSDWSSRPRRSASRSARPRSARSTTRPVTPITWAWLGMVTAVRFVLPAVMAWSNSTTFQRSSRRRCADTTSASRTQPAAVEHAGPRPGSRPRRASRPWGRDRSSRRCSRPRSARPGPAQTPEASAGTR